MHYFEPVKTPSIHPTTRKVLIGMLYVSISDVIVSVHLSTGTRH